jgi:tricorn protease
MRRYLFAFLCLFIAAPAFAAEPIKLANNPALSPDGQLLAFDWNGDIWLAPSAGGEAKQRTANPARDTNPRFSPNGKEIAFVSDREGAQHIYTMPVDGGAPRQLTFHSGGSLVQEYSPDGQSLLIKAKRDNFWNHNERFFTVSSTDRSAERLVFDDYGSDGVLSPDGKKLLFTREGEGWWRKGYKGSRVSQVWLHDLNDKSFTKVLHQEYGCRWPLWMPDGKGFYYVGEHSKGSNLFSYGFGDKATKQLTKFTQESVVFPSIARDGSKIVFRHLFDLYCYEPNGGATKKLDIHHNVDRVAKKSDTRILSTATQAAFTNDGLEIAFIAGGDLWVMDTELREPRQITKTAEQEADPIFTPDGQSILFVIDRGDSFAIMKATRWNPKQFWWQNRDFNLTLVLEIQNKPYKLKISPDGKKLSYVRERGDLCVTDLANPDEFHIFRGWNAPDYDWSPDGRWIAYAQQDSDFNRDIYLLPSDGKGKPFNVSRHPFSEQDPVFSPDGKMLAYAGRRASGDPGSHVCLMYLNPDDDETTARDRKLQKALDKMKSRTPGGVGKEPAKGVPNDVTVVFDGLHERVKRINLGEGSANTLFWSPDSKKLAFTGTYEGKAGTYAIDIGDTLTPKAFLPTSGANPHWLKSGNQVVWLVNGIPTSTPGVAAAAPAPATPAPAPTQIPKKGIGKGGAKGGGFGGGAAPVAGGGYTFSVRQKIDIPARNAVIFDTCWRIMRDHWYDGKLGNSDWDKVRAKYRDMARQAPDAETVLTCVQMMLGELNGSHLGFTMNVPADGKGAANLTREATSHLGVRFDPTFAGPGLKIRDVLPGGPAEKKRSRLMEGDVITKVDGIEVNRDIDLTLVLNGPSDREVALTVTGADKKTREVNLRPIAYPVAQALLYEHWLRHNRKVVADASKGQFGYLHISQMAMPNFRKFEEELVSQGAGRDGLVIDVRENPGGSIADHLLTALTQPVHAITVPRGGGPGYPMDRKVYTSWNKPIVVLCNQNSGSNAEIFSHAIKTLKRGQLVGVPTAGAVVSTGSAQVFDAGVLRLPTRGWFTLNDGEDMEKNGAVPHHLVWLEPNTLPHGRDAQMTKAIEVLRADVEVWKKRPQPKLKLSTDRP